MDKEEAMKILKDFHDKSALFSVRTALETLHPELRESEDEKMMHQLYSWMKEFGGAEEYTEKIYTWLKSLIEKQETSYTKRNVDDAYVEGMAFAKDELEKQGKQEPAKTVKWSPQEESCICQLESLVKEQWRHAEKVNNAVDIKKMQELMFFLKTLNPNKKPQRMISAEAKEAMYDKPACVWSEEDEQIKERLIKLCTQYMIPDGVAITCENWLKSLKQRYTWKPNIAQLNALSIVSKGNAPDDIEAIVSLYNDLKKLTE